MPIGLYIPIWIDKATLLNISVGLKCRHVHVNPKKKKKRKKKKEKRKCGTGIFPHWDDTPISVGGTRGLLRSIWAHT